MRDLFGGDIAAFVRESPMTLHTLQQLLEHQFARLTPLEQDVMYWLAIERDLVSLETLSVDLLEAMPRREVLQAIKSLRRRCLVERGGQGAVFTLQPEVMEYVGERLVAWICEEIIHTSPRLLLTHALMKAQSNDYIRLGEEAEAYMQSKNDSVHIRGEQASNAAEPRDEGLLPPGQSDVEAAAALLELLRHPQAPEQSMEKSGDSASSQFV